MERSRPKAKTAWKPASFFLAASIAVIPTACSREIVDLPGAFTFRATPVHPLAVSRLYQSREGMLDLNSFRTYIRLEDWENQPGWLIARLEEEYSTGRRPFFAYSAFTNLDPFSPESVNRIELYVLSIKFDDGTTGEISNLLLIEKQGPWLILRRVWQEGISCDGGLMDERIEGDDFFYSRELTPFSMIDMSSRTKLDLAPNEDLEAGVEDCIGAANYVYDLAEDKETLISVRLYDEPRPDFEPSVATTSLQVCFNRLYNSYLKEGKIVLGPEAFEEFVLSFKTGCVPAR